MLATQSAWFDLVTYLSKIEPSLLTGSIGRCYPEHVLKEYLKFCSRNGLHLISDEIYALSVWDNPRLPNAPGFRSVLSINQEGIIDPSFVHTVWGLSKVWHSVVLSQAELTAVGRISVQLD